MSSEPSAKKSKKNKNKGRSLYNWIQNDSFYNISTVPEVISRKIIIPKATYHEPENEAILKNTGTEPVEPEVPGILLQKILDAINSAEDFICISSFVIGNQRIEDAIVNAADRDVRVYLLAASENYLLKAILNKSDAKKKDEHIRFLNRLYGKALIRSSGDFHMKCVLVDPKNKVNKKGYLLTCNLTEAVSIAPDIGIKLDANQIDVLFHQFLVGFYHLADVENREKGAFGDLDKSNPIIPINLPLLKKTNAGMLFTIKESPLSSFPIPDEFTILSLKEELIRFIQDTEGEIKVFAWNFNDRSELVDELIKAIQQKRNVTVIVNADIWQRNVSKGLKKLLDSGAKIVGIPYFHAKGIISQKNEKKQAIIMTSNFEPAGIDYGFNTGIFFKDSDQVKKIEFLFDEWQRCGKYHLEKKQKTDNVKK